MSETATAASPLNLADPAFLSDPYPTFDRLRRTGPVVAIAPSMWAITGYQAVIEGLTDPRLTRSLLHNPAVRRMHSALPPSVLAEDFEHTLSQLDGQEHVALRTVASRALSPERFDPVVEGTRQSTLRWLSERQAGEEVELMATLARPLAEQATAHLLGVPEQRRAAFAAHVRGFLSTAALAPTPEGLERSLAGAGEIGDEADRVALQQPRSLLGDLAGELGGEVMRRLVRAILTAGIEPLETLVGIGGWSLAEEGTVRAAFCSRPDRAVMELLRWRHVGRFVPRVSRFRTDLHDQRVEAGDFVLLGIAAAHRDPRVFPDPDRFDPERDLAAVRPFGHGPATCIAARLARQVGEVVLETLARGPRFELVGPPDWSANPYLRSLRSLAVRFLDQPSAP